jgi:hypothetical protein
VRVELDGQLLAAASSLEVGIQPAGDLFAIEGRSNVRRTLEEGQPAAEWILPQLGGGVFDVASLRGRTTVVLMRSRICTGGCVSLDDLLAVVRPRADRLHALAIGNRAALGVLPFSPDELRAAARAGLPIVDDAGTDETGWSIDPSLGSIVLLDADLRVLFVADARSRTSLAAAIDSALSGQPRPLIPVADGAVVPGEPAPALRADRLDGGRIDMATLRGKPVVLLSPAWESSADVAARSETRSLLTELARARSAVGDRVTFIVIAWTEGYSGVPPEGWPDVLAAARSATGVAADDLIAIVGHTYGGDGWSTEDGWGALAWVGGLPSRWDPAIVVIDSAGNVDRVLWGSAMPNGAELAAQLEGILEVEP